MTEDPKPPIKPDPTPPSRDERSKVLVHTGNDVDDILQAEFRERLNREIALDGQLYDRLAQVEQILHQSLPEVPDHLKKRVAGLVERDKARRAKLRLAYMEEAEEYRDNGDQPEREIFLNLADWVTRGVGSVRQHSQLLDEFNRARDEYNEIRRDDDGW